MASVIIRSQCVLRRPKINYSYVSLFLYVENSIYLLPSLVQSLFMKCFIGSHKLFLCLIRRWQAQTNDQQKKKKNTKFMIIYGISSATVSDKTFLIKWHYAFSDLIHTRSRSVVPFFSFFIFMRCSSNGDRVLPRRTHIATDCKIIIKRDKIM